MTFCNLATLALLVSSDNISSLPHKRNLILAPRSSELRWNVFFSECPIVSSYIA
jgi:hypothetical protein